MIWLGFLIMIAGTSLMSFAALHSGSVFFAWGLGFAAGFINGGVLGAILMDIRKRREGP